MIRLINEQDEFLLSQLLDGDLPAEQAEELHRRMELEPELRQVYAQLSEVNESLTGRRADQPVMQWDAFRREIMDSIRIESGSSRMPRLARWFRVGVSLAAAASIALAVVIYNYRPAGEQPVAVVAFEPAPEQPSHVPQEDEPIVIFHRPGLMANARSSDSAQTGAGREVSSGAIQVSFEKSSEITEQYNQRDQMLRSSPSIQYHVGSPPVDRPVVDDLFAVLGPLG
ncbi:MAG: hypothetical protein GXY44_09765 [Phycisphaerales bacterium]|nr:hypothetical protein [Phycisphaerales bacterium]